MIYSFRYGRSLAPNQIFRRLILINGAFNVISALNIKWRVPASTDVLNLRWEHLPKPFPLLVPLLFFSLLKFFRMISKNDNQHISNSYRQHCKSLSSWQGAVEDWWSHYHRRLRTRHLIFYSLSQVWQDTAMQQKTNKNITNNNNNNKKKTKQK